MFNPQMFEQARKNIGPDQMKQMTGMFANMSDEQIRSYSQMAGMGNIDPSMLRNSASMMKNMKNDDLQNMTNMASQAYANKQETNQAQVPAPQILEDSYPTINELKTAGNKSFKEGNYDEASSKYLEAILEIEELWTTNKSINLDPIKRKELQTLETSCRLNYCNVKAKQGDYDIVRIQALQVLQKEENGKAYFRLGQAYRHVNDLDLAMESLEKAKELLPSDQTVCLLFDEVKNLKTQRNSQPTKHESRTFEQTQEKYKTKDQKRKDDGSNQKKQNEEKLDYSQPQDEQKQDSKQNISKSEQQQTKQKKPIKLQSVDINSEEFKELKKSVEEKKLSEQVIIKDEPLTPQQSQPQQTTMPQVQQNGNGPDINQSYEQFKNMGPDQMGQMSSMMKNMDKGMMKQMMKSQMGYEISDSQIEMMQKMMTPEMMKSMQNIDPNQLQQMQQQQRQQQGREQDVKSSEYDSQSNNTNNEQSQQTQQQAPQMPSMSGMLADPSMIQLLFNQLKSNPEMIKGLSGMMGPNHPLSAYIERSSPEDLSKIIGYLQKLLTVVLFFVRIYTMIRKFWLVIIGLLIAYIIFR